MKFKSDIEVQAGLRDGSDDIGTAGQILSSTGSQTNWIDPGTIISAASKLVVIACKNTSGSTITKGTPVYQTGTVGATDVIEIAEADASDEDKMAAIGLLQTDINNNDFGNVVITGELLNFTTSPIDGVTPTTGDTIYVKSGGGLTLTKPTGLEFIQNVGLVGKVSGGNAGSITVSSIMRSNDVPTPLYIDHDNQRLGIGTPTPGSVLDVQGTQGQLFSVTDDLSGEIFAVSDISGVPIMTVNSSGVSYFDGKVGIGTDSPNSKLHVLDGAAGAYTPYNESDTLVVESATPGGISLIGTGTGSASKQSIVFGTPSDVTSASILYDSNNSFLSIGTTTASNFVKFVSGNGVTALTLDASQDATFEGNVDVNGTEITVGTNGSIFAENNVRFKSSGAAYIDHNTTGQSFIFRTSTNSSLDTTALTLTSAGNIQVKGQAFVDSANTNYDISMPNGIAFGGAAYTYCNIFGDSGNMTIAANAYPANEGVVSTITFKTATSAGGSSTPMVINGDNVGIGTTSPGTKLDVAGDIRTSSNFIADNATLGSLSLRISGTETGRLDNFNSALRLINFHASSETIVQGNGNISLNSVGSSNIKLSTANTERMRITSGGNVGIGTTSPGTKLQVEGSIQANAQGRFKGWYTSGSGLALETGVSGGNGYVLTYNRDTSAYSSTIIESTGIQFVAHSSGKFYFTGGNVGIGYTNPSEKLSVDGTFGVSDLPFNTDSVSVLVADETIGADLVTNGDFATNTDWTEQGGAAAWSIANGKANCVVNSIIRYFEQPNVLPSTGAGNTYKVVYTISGITQGGFAINVGGYGSTPVRTANGTYAETFTITYASSNNRIYLQSSPNTIGSIDNVSVQLVTSASNQIQKRELGTGAFGPTPVGAYLPLTAGSGSPLTGDLFIDTPAGASQSGYALKLKKTNSSSVVQVGAEIFATPWASNTNGGTIIFKNADTATNLQETLRISANGSVGINSTSSSYKLDVGGNARFQDSVYIDTSTGSGGLYVTRLGNTNESLKIYTSDSTSVFETFQDENTGEYGSMAFILDNGAPDPSYVFRYGSIVRLKIEGGTGDVILKDALLSNQKNTNVDTGAEVVALVAHATYTAAFFDFVVKKGTNVRSGTVYACHNGDTTPLVEFTETSTNDLGDTSDVTLSVDISGDNMRLLATVTSDDWSVKSLIRAI